jgi:aminopeptidase-like protein
LNSLYDQEEGDGMYQLLETLFPICRSITGDGVRQSLDLLEEHIPLNRFEVPTGTQVFDWEVPEEWNIRDAYVLDQDGNKIIDFRENNLHVLGYSQPIDQVVELEELQQHLYSLPEQPEAIPFVTSYYERRWGFCLTHQQRQNLKPEKYRVFIDSELKQGYLTYGELILPGAVQQEIFLSTYICHPSMANNELSGPVVTTWLVKWLMSQPRRYTYRIVFIPETIGSITYLSRNLPVMKDRVIAGFNVTCVGDERAYSFMPTRYENTLADKVALKILSSKHPSFVKYSFMARGSDERQYCSPGVDLPVVGVMRSKYGEYPEYHTSLDNLKFATPQGLYDSYQTLRDCTELLERNRKYKSTNCCEPQLGKRGLYTTLSTRASAGEARALLDILAYTDGTNDLIDISNHIGMPLETLYELIDKLVEHNLIEEIQ